MRTLVVLCALTSPLFAQLPPVPTPPPIPPAAAMYQPPPLLFVKLIGPKGMQVTVHRGAALPMTFDTPCVLGLRPGFRYRLMLTNIEPFPLERFYPTLEVRGSLLLGNRLRNADYPAALVFTLEEFAKTKKNITTRKVVLLERPETALPQQSDKEQPLEIDYPPNRDPLVEARDRGMPVLVLHMGERQMTRDELINEPGTMLLPGEKVVPQPRILPYLPWQCFPAIDPVVGPAHPGEFVIVPDGGDIALPAGIGRDGKLKGLDPSDTVAEYFDSKGRKRVAISNRVGLCLPRFLVARTEMTLESQVTQLSPGATRATKTFAGMNTAAATAENSQKMQLEGVGSQIRPSGSVQTTGLSVAARVDGVVVTGTTVGLKAVDGACPPPSAVEPMDGPLEVIKWPDKLGGAVGDIITFTVKYTNKGGQPITNVVVSDSLTTRFEYVKGSARADRAATFTTQPNEAGSLILRWQIPGTLLPRESGVVQFQVRVR